MTGRCWLAWDYIGGPEGLSSQAARSAAEPGYSAGIDARRDRADFRIGRRAMSAREFSTPGTARRALEPLRRAPVVWQSARRLAPQ